MTAPTIAKLKTMGVTQFRVTCSSAACRHSSHVSFDRVAVADAYEFPEITARRGFVCTKCGGREVNIMPDWATHKASGVGG